MKRYTVLLIGVLLALILAAAGGAGAQSASAVPLDPILIDTGGSNPAVAVAPDGSFVVVWYDSDTVDSVMARHYAADGVPLGPAFSASGVASTTQDEFYGNIAMDGDGNYVIVWIRQYEYGQPVELYGRLFAADDTPLGPPFLINQVVVQSAGGMQVSMRADGRFVVVWSGSENDGDVKMRLFNPAGAPLTDELLATVTTIGNQGDPDVALAENGQIVVVWAADAGPNANSIVARRFNAAAEPLSGQMHLDSLAPFNYSPHVAFRADGGFVAVWTSQDLVTGSREPHMRAFKPDNDPAGPDQLVHEFTLNSQDVPSISPVGDGFLVAWQSDNRLDQENSESIYGRFLDAAGAPDGHEFHVSNCFGANYSLPAAGGNAAGEWVVAWNGKSAERCAEYPADNTAFHDVFAQIGPLREYAGPWFVGFNQRMRLGKDRFQPADIARFERRQQRWTMLFDASDLGITQNLKDFAVLPDGTLVLAFAGPQSGVQDVGTISPHSLYRYVPDYDYGEETWGTLSLYFDGGDVGLGGDAERIDAVATDWQGRLLISTVGAATVPGATAEDEDLLRFTPTTLGNTTAGSWTRFFDGSVAGVTQNLASVWVDPDEGDLFLTYDARVKLLGKTELPSTVLRCTPTGGGCTWQTFWKGSATGLTRTVKIDGFEMRP